MGAGQDESARAEAPVQAERAAEPAESASEPLGPVVPEGLLHTAQAVSEPVPVANSYGGGEVYMYDPASEEPQDLYGPPVADPDDPEPLDDPDDPVADNDGPSAFDPSDEPAQLLYGPPPFIPADEIQPVLYGPPPAFDPSDEPVQLLYGPPGFSELEPFDPSEEPAQTLYGPPSMFDDTIVSDDSDEADADTNAESQQAGALKRFADKLLGRDGQS